MKVDMSSEAITARLHAMDELWLLSIKLMDSKPFGLDAPTKSKAFQIQDSIRKALYEDWDPLGINDYPSTEDEYDAYIASVYRILAGSRSEDELIDMLRRIAIETMGVSSGGMEKLRSIAKELLELDVTI